MDRMMVLMAVLAAAQSGCGGGAPLPTDSPSVTMEGTVNEESFAMDQTMWDRLDHMLEGAPSKGVGIALTELDLSCEEVDEMKLAVKNRTTMVLALVKTDEKKKVVDASTGDYKVLSRAQIGAFIASPTAGKQVAAAFLIEENNAGKNPYGSRDAATSGTIHITSGSVSAQGYLKGTADLVFGREHVSGSFVSPYCNVGVIE